MELNTANVNDCAACFFLDVGQGTSQVVLLNQYRAIVVDTGRKRQQGQSPVIRLLERYKIKTIEALIISHNDSDHVGDIRNVVDTYQTKIKKIYFLKDRKGNVLKTLTAYLNTCVDKKILKANQICTLVKDDDARNVFMNGKTHITVLYPTVLENLEHEENNTCAIIALTVGTQKVIFSGDAPIDAWRAIVKRQQDKRMEVNILTVPHHGGSFVSKSNQAAELHEFHSELVKADYAVASFGTCNNYGHPVTEVIQSFAEHAEVFCMQRAKQCGGVNADTECCGMIIADIGESVTKIRNLDVLKRRKQDVNKRLCLSLSDRAQLATSKPE